MGKKKECKPCDKSKKDAIISNQTQPTTNEIKAGTTQNAVFGRNNNKKKTPNRTPIKHF